MSPDGQDGLFSLILARVDARPKVPLCGNAEAAPAAVKADAAAAAEAAEAAAKRQAEEEAAAAKAAAEAEAKRKKEMGNGKVVIKYEQYAEEFDIVDGSTTAAKIDDEYCLSFVMPKCKIFLSPCSPIEKTERARRARSFPSPLTASDRYLEKGIDAFFYVEEDPKQTYQGLEKGNTYWASGGRVAPPPGV